MPDILSEAGGHRSGVLEISEFGTPCESRGSERHHRDRADDNEHDADTEIGAFITHEARGDALVDDIALLEEELPRRHRGADDRDDQQDHLARLAVRGKLRNRKAQRDLADRRMNPDEYRDQQQATEHQQQREPLEATEITGAGRGYNDRSRSDDAQLAGQAEVVEGQADADELGNDRERVQQKKIDDAERAPEPPKALQNQAGVADAGHCSEAQHHLLIDVEDRHQQQQRPEQCGPIVLASLGIGAEGAGIVVADHDNETRTQNGQQRPQTRPPATPGCDIAMPNGAKRTADIADMSLIKDRARARRLAEIGRGHSLSPCARVVGG